MTQKSILIVLNILLTISVFGQINSPYYSRRDVPYCEITKIEINNSNTIVHFKYEAPSIYANGGWVCAGNNFFIRDNNSKKTYQLIKANNIPICPKKHRFQYQGQILEFNLVFEPIPTTTNYIDIIENETIEGFNFYDVKLISLKPNTVSAKSNPDFSVEFDNSKPTNCDEIKYVSQSSKPSFNNFLAGVKYAVITNYPEIKGHWNAFNALSLYLGEMDFTSVEYLKDNYKQQSNLCEEVWVEIYFDYKVGVAFHNIKMRFMSPCTGYIWDFSTSIRANDDLHSDTKYQFGKALRDMYGYKKPSFNSYYTLKSTKKLTCWTENKIKEDFQKNGVDKIEGIYENSRIIEAKYCVALKKIGDTYYLIYLSGANNYKNWTEGEIKATLIPTATPLFFKAKWIMADKSENDELYISFEQGMMNVIDHEQEKSIYIKMYPTSSDNITSFADVPASGTGFAITSNGLIVTNHHVVDGAKTINVRGINNDFSRTYSAKLVISDKNNDLAIIRIDDFSFSSLGTIPYTIKTSVSNVGENIFVLGYPLRATMGDEVKLTNGIISSKTGFQGDVTSYQISAPVQPGNSGGPLFNSKGQLIGIINAKHLGAESASYAVKSSYLTNLIDLLDYPPTLQNVSTVNGKSLTQQVQIIKKLVYIIEVK